MTELDKLNQITTRYIQQMSKHLIDNIFQASPFWKNDWKVSAEPDPFETFVRETRAEAGIVDPPRQPVCGGGRHTLHFLDSEWDGKNYSNYGDLDKS